MSLRPARTAPVAALLALLVGCASSAAEKAALPPVTPIMIPPAIAAPAGGESLAGHPWWWQRTQFADGRVIAPDAPDHYTLEFTADGRVAVRADCNRGGARYDAGAGATLVISPAALTKMGCPRGSQGAEFARQLERVAGYRVADGNLVLTLRDGGGAMSFDAPQR